MSSAQEASTGPRGTVGLGRVWIAACGGWGFEVREGGFWFGGLWVGGGVGLCWVGLG
jgi:hypothetical protein